MQNAATLMALSPAHVADYAIGFIHQNERLGISCNIIDIALETTNLVHLRGSEHTLYSQARWPGTTPLIAPQPPAVWDRYPTAHHSWLRRYSNLPSEPGVVHGVGAASSTLGTPQRPRRENYAVRATPHIERQCGIPGRCGFSRTEGSFYRPRDRKFRHPGSGTCAGNLRRPCQTSRPAGVLRRSSPREAFLIRPPRPCPSRNEHLAGGTVGADDSCCSARHLVWALRERRRVYGPGDRNDPGRRHGDSKCR